MPIKPLQVVEILERSEQGLTRPFLCRCDDDHLYYVKGRGAGRSSLLCEWLAGHLALAFGLPVPPFAIVEAPPSLVDLFPEGMDLGAGPAFGSRVVAHTQELSVSHLCDVPALLQRDVLVFDWWVRNSDRTLTSLNGNPNLLWDADGNQLVVIDHNVAFDREFDGHSFSAMHVFSQQIPTVFQDLVERLSYAERLRSALAAWAAACQNVPDEWWFADEERTVPADFDPDAVLALLARCSHEDFWRLAP
jgi:hypothetical protein